MSVENNFGNNIQIGSIIIVLYIILPIVYIYKLEELDDCSCVNDWRTNFFRFGGIPIMGSFIIILFFSSDSDVYKLLKSIILLYTFIYIVISLTYLTNLKNCQCAKEESKSLRKFLYVIFIISSIYVGIGSFIFFKNIS